MSTIETNRTLASLLGWTPQDFGKDEYDHALITAIREAQASLKVEVDGICGKETYGAVLKAREEHLVAGRGASQDWLRDAGQIALCAAKRTWLRDIIDLPQKGTSSYAPCLRAIDDMIRSNSGLGWSWQAPYLDNFEWCGAFACSAWRAAGLSLALGKTYFASTYRLDRYGSYDIAFEGTPNPAPDVGPRRKRIELDEHSGPLDPYFAPDDPPRAGDLLLVGGKRTGYGKHVTLVESYDAASGTFTTLEGNATGPGPGGGTRHGVIRGRRPVGLKGSEAATTYHARRLIRPAPADLE